DRLQGTGDRGQVTGDSQQLRRVRGCQAPPRCHPEGAAAPGPGHARSPGGDRRIYIRHNDIASVTPGRTRATVGGMDDVITIETMNVIEQTLTARPRTAAKPQA